MAALNKVFIIGNLTRDPELKYIPNGTALCTFSVAIGMKYKTKEGEAKEETVFVNNITAWGRLAEICGEYLQKGSPVFVEGRLRLDTWEDKETGKKRNQLRVTAYSMQMLGRKGDAAPGSPEKEVKEEKKPEETQEETKSDGGEENIPF